MDAEEKPAQARQAPGLVLHQIAAAADLEAERDKGLVVGLDGAQVAGAHPLGDGAGVLRAGLALAAGEALSGAVAGDPRGVDACATFSQRHDLEKAAGTPPHRGRSRPCHRACEFGDQSVERLRVVLDRAVEHDVACRVDAHRPVGHPGRVDADAYTDETVSLMVPPGMPRLACIALHSHRGHRVISGSIPGKRCGRLSDLNYRRQPA